MLTTKDIQYNYPHGQALLFPDVQVNKGEQLLVLGPSGSGKTTWLHVIAGIRRVQQGSIMINDCELTQMGQRDLDRFRSKNMGIIFQSHHLIDSLTVTENVMLAARFAQNLTDHSFAENLLVELGLKNHINALPNMLSTGEKQRVAIARALINNPGLILADEPTSSLDDANCQIVADLLQRHGKHAALVIITHDTRLQSYFPKSISL